MLPPVSRRTCTACRSAKVKCDRAGPVCGRCRRLGLPCVEQVRKQGRPTLSEEQPRYYSEGGGDAPGAAATAAAAAGGGNGYHHLPPVVPTALPSPLASVPSSLGVPYHHPVPAPEGAAAAMAAGRLWCGPQMVAEYVLAAFDKLRATGAVDQPRTLSLLRTMALQSLCWNQDYSCGLLDPLLARMGLALPDLESEYPEDSSRGCLARWGVRLGAGYDEPEGGDGGNGDGTQAAAPAEVGEAEGQQPQRPQQEEEPSGDDSCASAARSLGVAFGRIPPRLLSLDDRVSACCCTLTISGAATRVIVNQQFSDLFCPAADLQARILASHVPPPFNYAALVAPDDRLDFLEAMAAYLFSSSSSSSHEGTTDELSQIVRMRDCFDAPFLAIARLRVLSLAGGAYLGTMLAVTPAPSSKYIRGGNREEQHSGMPYSRLGLNYAEGRFRTRQPSAGMAELRGGVFVADNVAAEPVRRFFVEGGGGRAVLAAAVERYRGSASSRAAGGSVGAAAAAAGGGEEAAAGVEEQEAPAPSPVRGDGGVVVGVKRSRPSEEEEGQQEEHGEGEAAAVLASSAAAQQERAVEA